MKPLYYPSRQDNLSPVMLVRLQEQLFGLAKAIMPKLCQPWRGMATALVLRSYRFRRRGLRRGFGTRDQERILLDMIIWMENAGYAANYQRKPDSSRH